MSTRFKSTPLHGGAIAAPDTHSAAAAQAMLAQGGNAVDAAIAAAFALAVTYPEAGNIGGGGFMTVWFDGHPYFLDYRETAPAAATRTMYQDPSGALAPGLSLVGGLSVGVPGTVLGLWEAHRRFGTLPWNLLLGPAIAYAADGFAVHAQLVERRDVMLADFAGKTNFSDYFGAMREHEVLRQSELAATLERIAEHGPDDFYTGTSAALLLAQLANSGGRMTEADLAGYRVQWRAPIVADWRDCQVVTAPPPSSGGIGLLQLLGMKEALSRSFAEAPHNSAQYIHLMAEMSKRVFADRAHYIGDPDDAPVPVAALLDPAYLQRRAAQIDPHQPSPIEAVAAGLAESDETTHFSVIDGWGNAVSNTFTLNSKFGSGVVVAGAGFLLNNGMDDFSSKPGEPNRFGLMGAEANAIAPGKRMVSSMTPTILVKDGKVCLVIGTPGGSRIFTSIFQVMNNLFDFGMPLDESVAAMRAHHQLFPENTIYWEPYAPIAGALAQQLEARGYNLKSRFTNGDIQAIEIVGDTVRAVADPRARGVAISCVAISCVAVASVPANR